MAKTEHINVQIDQNALGVVLDAFRSMRDTPGGVDYSIPVTSSPEGLVSIIAKLEGYEKSGPESITIPMNDHEWYDYIGFMYYAAIKADCLEPEVNGFLEDLYEEYSDWEDNGFKPNDAGDGPG